MSAVTLAQDDVRLSPLQLNRTINCDEVGSGFCLDRYTRLNYEGKYVGHDEPSLIFYSSTPGSGSTSIYNLILPKDPPLAPKQDGTGGTYNFQLHPAFWFGMAMCDTQSAPNPDKNGVCIANSDTNIADNTNRNAPDYIGKHAGTAFLELQFYPPGWIASPQLLSSRSYFAALNIDSYSFNMNTNRANNRDCRNQVGDEPVNFAVITKNGIPLSPGNPLGVDFGKSNFDISNALFMRPGDRIRVTLKDSPQGVVAMVEDLTSGQSGFIVGGPESGFGQVNYDPAAATCTVTPYAFRPMYNTASESTRVPWATHSYNVAFSDEIGHFEFCDAFNANPDDPHFLDCTKPGAGAVKLDADDAPCANPAFFGLPSSFQAITGCVGSDTDFEGPAYGPTNWAGTGIARDESRQPAPILVTSPLFLGPSGTLLNYERVAFETDLAAIQEGCNTSTGAGCQNPPAGAKFYPIYSTTTLSSPHQCWWQLGGPNIPGTINNFGGTSTSEFGELFTLAYPTRLGPVFDKGNFRRLLESNPCPYVP